MKLTDEEVWLRLFVEMSSLRREMNIIANFADQGLKEFRERFPKDAETPLESQDPSITLRE